MALGIEVTCEECRRAKLADSEYDPTGTTLDDQFSFLQALAEQRGWAVRVRGSVASFHCRECRSHWLRPPTAPMEKYSANRSCSKCGHPEASTEYRKGEEPDSLFSVEHLVRRCTRCGYRWAEAPLA